MVCYRIHPLDRHGRICGVPDEVQCESDQEAVSYASTKLNGLDLEVWQAARRVIQVKIASVGGPLASLSRK